MPSVSRVAAVLILVGIVAAVSVAVAQVSGVHVVAPVMYAVTHIGQPSTCDGTAPANATHVVRFDGSFTPQTIRVTAGGTVTWVSDGPRIWVASNFHPAHGEYGLDEQGDPVFDQQAPGCTYAFSFTRSGEWTYHDHLSAREHGTVIVDGQ